MQIIGPPKNPLHMFNPQLLQLPIFKDIIAVLPFMYRNSTYAMNLVGMKQEPLHGNGGAWGQNEVGPLWSTATSAVILDSFTLENFDWNNCTQVSWVSSTAANVGRRIMGGCYIGASEYIRWGYSDANFYAYVRSSAGSGLILTEPSWPINDGNIHCCIFSSKPTSLEGYLDGVEVGSVVAAASNLGDNTHHFEIGDNWATDDPWIGTFSLVMLWNRGLSPSECQQIYEMGPSLTPLQDNFPIPYRGAIGAGSSSFEAGWANNSNQVII